MFGSGCMNMVLEPGVLLEHVNRQVGTVVEISYAPQRVVYVEVPKGKRSIPWDKKNVKILITQETQRTA